MSSRWMNFWATIRAWDSTLAVLATRSVTGHIGRAAAETQDTFLAKALGDGQKVYGFRIAKQVLDGLEDGAVRFLVERLRLEDVDHGIDGRQFQHARTENRFLQLDGLRLFLADSRQAGGEGGILSSAFALGLQGFVFGHVQQGMKNQIRRSPGP